LSELGVDAHVVMTGYVSDDELIWLYRNCYANLYPSLFEGLGLPVLEGMQFGAPTLASNATSIPEVAGHAAILLAPEDIEGWAQVMLRLAANRTERDRLRDAAKKQAARFNWEESANQLLKLYEAAAASPKRSAVSVAQTKRS
jgi:glycosyltransferase involved in cell wall biosynthesis